MPSVIKNEGTTTEYSVMEIIPGAGEEVTLHGVHDYSVLTDINEVKIAKFSFNGLSLVEQDLPLHSNPREPGPSTPVNKMKGTLEDEPNMFHLYNNGMSIFASNIKFDKENDCVKLTFSDDFVGICNGGHTYYACKRAISEAIFTDDWFINCEVFVLPELPLEEKKTKSVKIARARNMNRPIREESIADQLGYFDELKNAMGEYKSKVVWHENDTDADEDAIQALDLLRYIACLCPTKYKHHTHNPNGSHHQTAAQNAKTHVWKKYYQSEEIGTENELKVMFPMVIEILKIRDYLFELMANEDTDLGTFRMSNLYQQQMADAHEDPHGGYTHIPKTTEALIEDDTNILKIATPLEVMIMGCLRSNVNILRKTNGEIFAVGWYLDPRQVIDAMLSNVLSQLKDDYAAANFQDTAFKRASAPYTRDFCGFSPLNQAPNDSDAAKYFTVGSGEIIRGDDQFIIDSVLGQVSLE